jgi:hypothetical protein
MNIPSVICRRHTESRTRTALMLERVEDRCTPATFDLSGTVLTVNGTAGDDHFQFSQQTTADNNIFFTTNYTFTMNGQSQTYTNNRRSEFGPIYQITQVFVLGNSGNDTGVLVTNDTHTSIAGNTVETRETAVLGPGGGVLYLDDPGVAAPFLQFNGFANTYAYMGRADTGTLTGVPSAMNIFVTAGAYSYVTGGGEFHLISGLPSLYGYSASGSDLATPSPISSTRPATTSSPATRRTATCPGRMPSTSPRGSRSSTASRMSAARTTLTITIPVTMW